MKILRTASIGSIFTGSYEKKKVIVMTKHKQKDLKRMVEPWFKPNLNLWRCATKVKESEFRMFLLLSNNHSLSEIFETSEVFCWSPFFVNPDPSPRVILAVSLLKHRSTETQFSQKLSFFIRKCIGNCCHYLLIIPKIFLRIYG